MRSHDRLLAYIGMVYIPRKGPDDMHTSPCPGTTVSPSNNPTFLVLVIIVN